MKSKVSFAVRQTLLWSLSLLAFVLTLEASIRLEDRLRWGAPILGTYSHDALFVTDSLGWHPRPGARYQKWAINEYGFRGPEIVRQKPAGVVRIVVLGSSEAYGQAESPGQEFPRVLERELNARAAEEPELREMRFEVINAGIPGMSVARMPEYWTRWVGSFEADVVLVYPSPAFYLSNREPTETFSIPATASAEVADGPRLLPKTREAINRFLPERVESIMKRWLIARTVSARDDSWVWREVPLDRLAAYLQDVENLVATVSDSGASIVLVTHASSVERPLDAEERAVLLGWQKFFPRALPDVILDFERRANDDMALLGREIGATVVRADHAVPADRALFSDHAHFTDAGAAVLARSLLDAVLRTALDRRLTLEPS